MFTTRVHNEPAPTTTTTAKTGGDDDVYHDAKDSVATAATAMPLIDIIEAFEDLRSHLKAEEAGKEDPLNLNTFCHACSFVPVLFGCLGLAFKFAESEFVIKLRDLEEASKKFSTLENLLDHDLRNKTVRTPGSHSRNLRRIRQGLDLIRALFQQFVACEDGSLRDVASTAYTQVCAPFHTWTVRTAVSAGMYTLPTREQLLLRLNESEQTADKKMKRYINAVVPIVKYIDNLYTSRNITLDW